MSWAHPEGKNGTHRDYAKRGNRKQPSETRNPIKRAETPEQRYDHKLRELREAGL
jgi:hypothetical protein